MKKRMVLVFLLVFVLFLGACGGTKPAEEPNGTTEETENDESTKEITEEPEEEKPVIRIQALKGATTMGLVKLLEDNENGISMNKYEYEMAQSADTLIPKLTQGEVDIACIPANLASILFNKTEGKIQISAVNTLGVTYIVTTEQGLNSLEDLKGKTIPGTGKQSVPDLTLRSILKANGIDPDKDLTFDWKTEPTEVVGILASTGGTAMLPEPFVTVAKTKVEGLYSVFNLSEEWEKVHGSPMITGVTVVRTEFAEQNGELVQTFLEEYKSSIEYVNANIDEASEWIEKYDIASAPIAKQALPYCNLHFMDGAEMKSAVSSFLSLLSEEDMGAVGGKLPDDTFYYTK